MIFHAICILLIIHRNLNEYELPNGRILNPKSAQVLGSNEAGWYYIHIPSSDHFRKIEEKLGQKVPTSSIINQNWICIFLTNNQINQISSTFYLTPKHSTDKFISSDLIPNPSLLSDEEKQNQNSYLIHAHPQYFNSTATTEYYPGFYITNSFPDLSDPSINSVEVIPKGPELLNRWAVGYSQSEEQFLVYQGNSLVTNRPIHEHGLRGDNVIITIIDSGIDTTLPYFKDKDLAIPFNKDNLDHRKIVRYEVLADTTDSPAGHGTHVAGILTGNALCDCFGTNETRSKNNNTLFDIDNNKRRVQFTKKGPDCYSEFGFNNGCRCSASLYNGHAPNSKLYMIDAGLSKDPSSLVPNIDFNRIIAKAKQFHSKIMSNSWGFPPCQVGFRHMFDTIAYDNPDILMIFGAGNSRKKFDTYTPANSKNCLGVGGTSNSKFHLLETMNSVYFLQVKDRKYPITSASWSESVFLLLKTDPLPNFRNLLLESHFDLGNSDCTEKICISNTTSCNIVENAQQRNCKVLIMPTTKNPKVLSSTENINLAYSNLQQSYEQKQRQKKSKENFMTCSNVNIPVFFSDIQAIFTEKFSNASILLDTPYDPDYSVSEFNSGGPSDLGLLKPDIMAPGHDIRSACSSGPKYKGCDSSSLLRKHGTSMAVPVISASASLILQYFRDGFFPFFLTPSAALMKAMLINCAGPRDEMPNNSRGFGLIHLDQVLPFPESSFRLLIGEMIPISENSVAYTTFVVHETSNGAQPLCITLSWDDPPVSSESQIPVFANLDLMLITPSNEKFKFGDNRITLKRIFLKEAKPGKYELQIICPVLYKPDIKINFAVAITGAFNKSGILEFNQKPLQREKCDIEKTGYFCEQQVIPLTDEIRVTLKPRQYSHFVVIVPDLNDLTPNNNTYKILKKVLSIQVRLSVSSTKLVQIEIAHGQTFKYGGQLLDFEKLNSSTTEFRIDNETISNLQQGDLLYISLNEATDQSSSVQIEASIIEHCVRKNEDHDINLTEFWSNRNSILLKYIPYKPHPINYSIIKTNATYKLAPSKRLLPTTDYNTNDLSEIYFYYTDQILVVVLFIFALIFFALMCYSLRPGKQYKAFTIKGKLVDDQENQDMSGIYFEQVSTDSCL